MSTEREGHRLDGRYVLESLIATGGMGEVWRGRDEILGRHVAIKVLRDQLARDPDILERFRTEAVAAARLSHPGVIRVFDTGLDGDTCYIVMELVDGPTLAESLARRGPMHPSETVHIARGILDALCHAHAAGVIHRDVKPTNVLTSDHAVKVTDFGIAKAAFSGSDLTTTGKLLGTAKYLAPEQAAGDPVDERTDLYSLGIVMYEMLTGRVPFDAETDLATAMLRLTREPSPPSALRGGIPRSLEKVVLRALSRDPNERFPSAEEMRAALDRIELPSDRVMPQERHHRTASVFRSWMLIPLILGVLTAGAIAAGLAVGRLEVGGPFLVRVPDQAETEPAQPIRIVGATDFDPEGDNNSERPELVILAHDDDPATFWKTETYRSPDMDKSGVGIVFDLGEPRRIDQLRLRTTLSGWRFGLQGSNDPSSFSQNIPSVQGSTTFTASPRTTVPFLPVEYRYVLIWITRLAEAEGGYQATIAEAQFSGG